MTNMKEGRDGLISIIVPMYRAAEYIEETIACVEKQTYTDWELILVDDCGPDESLPVAARCRENSANREKIRIVRNERNLGRRKPEITVLQRRGGVISLTWMRMISGFRQSSRRSCCSFGRRTRRLFLPPMNSGMRMRRERDAWSMFRRSLIFAMR